MKIIFCIDEKGGLMFNGRRQSRDRAVCEEILNISRGHRLFATEYSQKMLGESACCVAEKPCEAAGEDDFCFLESPVSCLCGADRVYIFNWNRHYPADVKFDFNLLNDFLLESTKEFKGFSHEKITLNIYKRGDTL